MTPTVDAVESLHAHPRPSWRTWSRRGLSVALVGADGAGKSTVTGLLSQAGLPRPVKAIYMGVNLEASSLMLPTTWALLAVKRARGGRPDLVAGPLTLSAVLPSSSRASRLRRAGKDAARLLVWGLEEWLRELVARFYELRGWIVVFDRHFYADYYHADVAPRGSRRGGSSRVHGWMLQHLYPKPDLVLCLDAPSEVLYARKQEAPPAWLEQRRRQYLDLAEVVPNLVVIDATRPVDAVLGDVVAAIEQELSSERAGR
ncbi:MAG TPA: hypothetical protein VFG72_01125 [Marmoricola sp.]|nr:hypothetical protein [Marmoricola sp.]